MNTVFLLLVSCALLMAASGTPQVFYSPFVGRLNSSAPHYYAVQYLGNSPQRPHRQDFNLTHGEVDAPNEEYADDSNDESIGNLFYGNNDFVEIENDDVIDFSMNPYDANLSSNKTLLPQEELSYNDDDEASQEDIVVEGPFDVVKGNVSQSTTVVSNQTSSSAEMSTEVPENEEGTTDSAVDLETNYNSSSSTEVPDKVIPAFVHPIHRPSSEWPLKAAKPLSNRIRRRKPQIIRRPVKVIRKKKKRIGNTPNIGLPVRNPRPNKPKRVLLSTSTSGSGPCGKCQCGVTTTRRIVGGRVAAINEFPWLALITYNDTIQCGGTLINDRFVVTAAHCVRGFDMELFQLRFLEHNVESSSDTVLALRRITKIYSPESYDIKTSDNDIAMLKLSKPIQFATTTLRPVCLPTNNMDFTGKTGTIAGWGSKTEEGEEPPQIVQKTMVPILSNEQCLLVGMKITNNMLCAGRLLEGDIDGCQGDSGGPLMVVRNKRHYLAGVVSWGDGCARPNKPGIYTRVTKHLPWIQRQSKGSCKCN